MPRSARRHRRHPPMAWLCIPLMLAAPTVARAVCFDADDDGFADVVDVCPAVADGDQLDTDQDGVGDACDCAPADPDRYPGANELPDGDDEDCDALVDEGPDGDRDGVGDVDDVCPFVADPDQADADADLTGDACETQRVAGVWPPPNCTGVPPGLPVRVRFSQSIEAPVLAAGAAPSVGVQRMGPLGGQLVLDADGAGFQIDALRVPAAGEQIDVRVPTTFGLAFGFQWSFQLGAVDEDGFERAPDPAQDEMPPWSSAGAALADLDADGDLDLVLTGVAPGESARVYLNRGDATFDRVPGGTPIGAADVLVPGDLDGDGRVDVLARRPDGTIAWMRNVLDDGLVAQPQLGFSGTSVALGDFDGDGALDILAPLAGLDGAAGRVFRNVGGLFAARIPGTGGGMMSAAGFVDADADGDLDVVTTNGGANGALRFWENGGPQGALPAVTLTTRPRGVGPTASGDLDGDGRPEIIAPADRVPGEIYERALDGTFSVVGTVPDNGNGRLVATDDDGDGDADLWVEPLGGGQWTRYRTAGGQPVATTLRLPVNRPVFGDLDGDGDLDAVSPGTPAVVYLRRPDDCPADPLKVDPGECGCGAVEQDTDHDGVTDCVDTCPGIMNPDQVDFDGDGAGDACETDDDNDGVPDFESGVVPWDFFPHDPNICADDDRDGCDDCAIGADGVGPLPDKDPRADGPDADGDGLCDSGDLCPDAPDPDQQDGDRDGLGDACDPCPDVPGAICAPIPDAAVGPDAAVNLDAAPVVDAGQVVDAVPIRDAPEFPDQISVAFDAAVAPDVGAPALDAARAPDARGALPDGAPETPADASAAGPDRGAEVRPDARPLQDDASIPRPDEGPGPSPDSAVVHPADGGPVADATRPPPDGHPTVDRGVVADGAPDAARPPRDAVGLESEAGTGADAGARADAAGVDAAAVDAAVVDAAVVRGLEPKGGGGCGMGGRTGAIPLAVLLPIGLLWRRRRRPQPAATSARPTCSPRA